MSTRCSPVPLPELAAAAPLDYIEAATIVRDVAQRVLRDEFPGVPSAHVIRISPCGAPSVEGPIAADGSAVRRAAHLLETLLPGFEAQVRVPGALRLIVARALGTLDLPRYPSLESFADAVSRFAATDPAECFRQLVASRPDAPNETAVAIAHAHDLMITVSDIRRARRATGVPLAEISRRCDVPAHRLRELEWGYLENWPASHIGRRLIISYARAAGLDEQLVTRTVWPLLAESVRSRGALPLEEPPALPMVVDITVPEAVTSTSLARIEPVARRRWNTRRIVAALTIPALLAIGAAPAIWEHSAGARREAHRAAALAPARAAQPPIRETDVIIVTPPAAAKPVRTSGVIVKQASYRVAQSPRVTPKRAAPAKSTSAIAPQARRAHPRIRGPRQWGVWVLNKVGVKIVSTEQQ
jgi:hypothetical protein